MSIFHRYNVMRTDKEIAEAFALCNLFFRDGTALNYSPADKQTIAVSAACLAWVQGLAYVENFEAVLDALRMDRWKLGDFGNGQVGPME